MRILTKRIDLRAFCLLVVLPALLISCKEKTGALAENFAVKDHVEVFLPGLVSTGMYERDIAITPDGDEIIYTLGDPGQNRRVLVSLKKQYGKWGKPQILNISGFYHDIEPFFAEDGNRLYFSSNRPLVNEPDRKDYNIWYSIRQDTSWSEPIALDTVINSRGDEFYPSMSSNGNLYFTASRKEGKGREDIYLSKLKDGNYTQAVSLDSMINTPFYEFNAYVSPDEDLLLFSSYGRKDDHGGGDLYFSQKDSLGNWSKAKNMGSGINSEKLDYCPFIDFSGEYLYFTSERTDDLEGRLGKVQELTEIGENSGNGFGDIYRMELKNTDIPISKQKIKK